MKKEKNKNFWICLWLAIIAIFLLCGVVLFAAYIYKFDPLSLFTVLFQTDASVVWNAINVFVTFGVGIATVVVSVKLKKIQEAQANIENKQHQLQTEPHILIEFIEICPVSLELTTDETTFKTIKDVDYPYYTNNIGKSDLTNSSIIVLTFVNTSEAFTRLRFNEALIKHNDDVIASYNMSTIGFHKEHIMLKKGNSGKIGLLIENELLTKLEFTKLTISTFLDNNFNECFSDIQSYSILGVCEENISFIPCDFKENVFKKVE